MERGEELRIRVDGDTEGNLLTGRWRFLRQPTYKRMDECMLVLLSFENDYSALDRAFDLILKWLSDVRFNSCINSILNQQVDHTTLITLAPFYDLPLRCFTFQDFQLAPMFEEFEHLVRIPMKNKPLFEGTDESLPLETIVSTLHMDENEVEANLETKGNTKGFSLNFLLERAHTLLKAESWDACYSAIALTIYGVVLFPNMDGFWFLEHLPKTSAWVEQTDVSWPQRLGSLRSEDLSWYSKEYINMDIIFSCGDFPNLPLIGTQGCPPEAKSLEAFLLLDFGVKNPSLFQQIKEAWKNVNRKGKSDLERANGITKEQYFWWVRERVEMTKMPFVIQTPIPLLEPKLTHVPIEEVEELKNTVAGLSNHKVKSFKEVLCAKIWSREDENKHGNGSQNSHPSNMPPKYLNSSF
ncbi:hypothetical protein KIW84_062439 [Lathyrus oleraceus]|uniref:DUF7745 domain-containing protein n=1 Tax=Pisum sativum TaxID=3888 RepID=A0A9D5A6F2_PEA|nr:hypothetical protein KIW84_062439 [Pisum sativum]